MTTKASEASGVTTIDLRIAGMDCEDESNAIDAAVGKLAGVREVRSTVSGSRTSVTFDAASVTRDDIEAAIRTTGCAVLPDDVTAAPAEEPKRDVGEVIGWGVLGMVVTIVAVAAIGERFGLLDRVLERLPWWIPALAILAGGWKVFKNVAIAARHMRVTSHTLMTSGVIASAAVGQWTTAALIVFFMRLADWLEDMTTERSRRALEALVALQPPTARVLRDGIEVEVPVEAVAAGELVVVRPGERIPVDGQVVEGEAPVDQSSITGESIPIERTVGDSVFASTVAQAGYLQVRATRVGADTTLARIVRLVEDAESRKAPVQKFADRFSAYYLPAVLLMGLGTYLVTGEVLRGVAVLVVACACAITLATPVVVLASVGNAARRGLLVKGGITLEQLARIDTLVVDKTGTLTHGEPRVTDVIALNGMSESDLLQTAATLESHSEHPLARAIVREAHTRGLKLFVAESFTSLTGRGVAGTVAGTAWAIGNRRLLAERAVSAGDEDEAAVRTLEQEGKTTFFVSAGGSLVGLIAVADTVRAEVVPAFAELRSLGVRRVVLLTGDNERVAAAIARQVGIEDYRADLLPEDKIAAVRALQAGGAVVMMVGDGVNDGPALVQADVGVAMGAAGTDVALEAADVALMRDDWTMVPECIRLGRRAAGTIRQNLVFTAAYNVVGIALAFLGILPPVWAAAAQSIPDVAIMGNSARLLRTKQRVSRERWDAPINQYDSTTE